MVLDIQEQEYWEEAYKEQNDGWKFMREHPEEVEKFVESHPEMVAKLSFKETMRKQANDLLEQHRANANTNPLSWFISESLKGMTF